MKFQSMPVKRRSKKKGAFRTLFANVARKKKRQRASTAAMPAGDIDGDVPNLGVARALVVILLIHVVAIAGIFFHSHWLDGESADAAALAEKATPVEIAAVAVAAAPAPAREDDNLPKIKSGDSIYTVGTGDTYENIASRFGVDETELRVANDNIEIRAGRYLRVPPKKIVAIESAEITQVRESSGQPVLETIPEPAAPPMITTDAARRADGVPAAAATTASTGPAKATHVVKSGDTFWSISKKYGSSVDAVMQANGITNPKHLKIGVSLTIPK